MMMSQASPRSTEFCWTSTEEAPKRPAILTRREGLRLAQQFLDELESQRLEVVLIPSKHWEIAEAGGKIRAVQFENPKWYQKFCEMYPAHRGGYQSRCDWCGGIHDRRKGNRCLRRHRTAVYTRAYKSHFDTAIKRRDTIRGLNELLSGRCVSEYAQRLRDFIRRHWTEYL